MRLPLIFSVLILISCEKPAFSQGDKSTPSTVKNTVVVMGMIHSGHRTSQEYSLARVKDMIRQVKPDFVLTEIPPDRLPIAERQYKENGVITEPRVRVFPEYTDALFPLTKTMDFEIIPCAAWTSEMNDSRRTTMANLKKTHAQQYAEMTAAQNGASKRIAQLGNANDPRIIHSDAYDRLVKQGMGPYDRHFNDLIGDGGWTNINKGHYDFIDKALNARSGAGKTFLITFGSWHKYYIKEQLRKRTDIKLVSLQKFLTEDSGKNGTAMNWSQFRMTADRCAAYGETNISQPAVAWQFDTGEIIESSPAIYDGLVFVGGHSKRMHALDQTTGEKRWVFETAGWIRASPSVVDGAVYFGSDDNMFYALNAKTGQKKWSFGLGEGGEQSSPAIVDGVVYFGGFDHFVYALNADDGSLKWKFDAEASMLSSPAVSDSTVFIATYDGKMFAIDRTSGQQKWVFQENNKPIFSTPLLQNGILYFTSYDHHIYAVDAATGKIKWQHKTSNEVFSSPTIADGAILVGSNDKHLYSLNAESGAVNWKTDLKGAVFACPCVSGDMIYVGSSDGYFYGLQRTTGEIVWRHLVKTGANVWSSAAAIDGRIYFGSHAGKVVALEQSK